MSKLFRRIRRLGGFYPPPPVTSRPGQRRLRLEVLEQRQLLSITVSSGADDGSDYTLRWAIEQANQTAGHDTIEIDDRAVSTITITEGQLPVITDGVSITTYLGGRVVVECGQSTANIHGLQIAIASGNDDNVSISHLQIADFTGAGILVYDDFDTPGDLDLNTLTVANCTIDHNGTMEASASRDGIQIAANVDATSVTISNCDIIRNGNVFPGDGIASFGDITDLTVQNSYIGTDADGNPGLGNGRSGIDCAGTGKLEVKGCTICSNGVAVTDPEDEPLQTGIRVLGPGDSLVESLEVSLDGNWIGITEGNNVLPNLSRGIYLAACNGMVTAGDNENVTVNILNNNVSWNGHGLLSGPGLGVCLQACSYVKIDNCVISDNRWEEGILLATGADDTTCGHITISNNTISNNEKGGVSIRDLDQVGGYIEYVDVVNNAFSKNSSLSAGDEIATWVGDRANHCRFSHNNFSTVQGYYIGHAMPIFFEVSGSNEGIVPPVIVDVSFGYDETAGENGENVWTIPFTVAQSNPDFANSDFVFEVYASNAEIHYGLQSYGPGDYFYLCEVARSLVGPGGDFEVKVPASLIPDEGCTEFLITATCVDLDRKDTSVFSDPAYMPPQVTGVTVFNRADDEYDIPACYEPGTQLNCVPFRYDEVLEYTGPPEITQIEVTFSQDVNVEIDDLTLVDFNPPGTIISTLPLEQNGFSYVPATRTATWKFYEPKTPTSPALGAPITGKQLVLTISEDVAGAVYSDLKLDGEWTNPTEWTSSGNSVFPSGNGVDGEEWEDFVFFFTVPSPADFNLDGKVDLLDLGILGDNWNGEVPAWGPGDATGEGDVDLLDLDWVSYHWNSDLTHWGGPTERAGGSSESTRRELWLALDALFESYGLDTPAASQQAESSDAYWDGFFDDLFDIFSELAA